VRARPDRPSGFEAALARQPAPARLGDVRLRFDAFLLVGETPRSGRSWQTGAAAIAGFSALLSAAGLQAALADVALVVAPVLLGGLALAAAAWLEQRDRRRRAFVANFGTTTLRLDFVTPFAGRPRTLRVPFDAVKAVALWPQADGAWCLAVDFSLSPTSPDVLREVLAAHIPEAQRPEAERLQRVLEGAFGLGAPRAAEALISAPSGYDSPAR
jgi:hypothetical protein